MCRKRRRRNTASERNSHRRARRHTMLMHLRVAIFVLCLGVRPIACKESREGGWAKALALSRAAGPCAGTTGGVVVDVGARGGGETALALGYGYTTVTIECSPDAHRSLKTSLQKSIRDKHVALHFGCATDKAGTITLNLASDSSSVNKRAVSGATEVRKAHRDRKAYGNHSTLQVPALVVDELLPPAKTLCAVKSDAQGHEFNVLKGLSKALKRDLPVLYFEFDTHFMPDDAARDLPPWLESLGYECAPRYCIACNILCTPKKHQYKEMCLRLDGAKPEGTFRPLELELREKVMRLETVVARHKSGRHRGLASVDHQAKAAAAKDELEIARNRLRVCVVIICLLAAVALRERLRRARA